MQTRSTTKRIEASLPWRGTVCTRCHHTGHTSRKCPKAERQIVSVQAPRNDLPALARTQPGLSTLPREIRDLIYKNLVTSCCPIKVCYDFKTSTIYLRLLESEKGGIAATFLCHVIARSSLAVEVYEVFFRSNIFEFGDCGILEEFIRFGYTLVEIRRSRLSQAMIGARTLVKAWIGERYQPLPFGRQELTFDRRPWVRNITINLHCDHHESAVVKQLSLTSKLLRLQRLDIWIHGLCNKHGQINTIDQKIGQIADVCKRIRERIGARLTVWVLKSWLGICASHSHHYLHENSAVKWENVGWMWEPLSNEAIAKVMSCRIGTHREHMQMLMATNNLTQDGPLRRFAGHWLQDHKEQEALAKSEAVAKNAVH